MKLPWHFYQRHLKVSFIVHERNLANLKTCNSSVSRVVFVAIEAQGILSVIHPFAGVVPLGYAQVGQETHTTFVFHSGRQS